jgi:hypothetical protein
MKREIKAGKTDYSALVFIPDPASTDGSGKTGLVAANLTVSGTRVETDNDVVITDYTSSLNDLSALTDAHNDWGVKEVSSTLAPGLYRLDIADAIFAAGAWTAVIYVMITSSAAAASPMEFVLVSHDPDSLVAAMWDEVLTSATHNVSQSAGKRLRELSNGLVTSGTAQAGGAASITLATAASSVDGTYDPAIVRLVGGTGAGQARLIIQYVGSTRVASVDRDWRVVPDSTSEYEIVASQNLASTNEGLAQGGGASSITLNANASSIDNTYVGQSVVVRTGTGQDQSRVVSAYNGTTKVATVAQPWITQPISGSGYMMWPLGRAYVTQIESGAITAASIAAGALDAVWSTAARTLTSGANIVLAKGTGVTGFNDLSAAQVNAEADAALADVGLTTTVTSRIDAAISSRLASASYTAPDNTGIAAAAAVAAKLDTALQLDGAVYQFTTNALELAPAGGGGGPTVQQIVDGVWDEMLADHLDLGSTGSALNNATAAGNPWEAIVEGSYTGGDLLRVAAGVAAGLTDQTTTGSQEADVTFTDLSQTGTIVAAHMVRSKRVSVVVTP